MKKYKLIKLTATVLIFTILSTSGFKIVEADTSLNNKIVISDELPKLFEPEITRESFRIDYKSPFRPDPPKKKEIIINFVGDCTIGSDKDFGYSRSFNEIYDTYGADHFFKNVLPIFENDDLSIINFEGTFTNSTNERTKAFNFKGNPEYIEILKSGSIEIANIANNHTYDYYDEGYQDTLSTFEESKVDIYDSSHILIKEVKGIKIGFVGFMYFGENDIKEKVDKVINYLNENEVDVKVVSFHWGIERDYTFNEREQDLAHYVIDSGVNLVIGHHPHVLQGIEDYNGGTIAYSLGNFSFGGNKNPSDKDSMIFQMKYYTLDDKIINSSYEIIPVSISSEKNKNLYNPTILENEEKERVMQKVLKNSN